MFTLAIHPSISAVVTDAMLVMCLSNTNEYMNDDDDDDMSVKDQRTKSFMNDQINYKKCHVIIRGPILVGKHTNYMTIRTIMVTIPYTVWLLISKLLLQKKCNT